MQNWQPNTANIACNYHLIGILYAIGEQELKEAQSQLATIMLCKGAKASPKAKAAAICEKATTQYAECMSIFIHVSKSRAYA